MQQTTTIAQGSTGFGSARRVVAARRIAACGAILACGLIMAACAEKSGEPRTGIRPDSTATAAAPHRRGVSAPLPAVPLFGVESGSATYSIVLRDSNGQRPPDSIGILQLRFAQFGAVMRVDMTVVNKPNGTRFSTVSITDGTCVADIDATGRRVIGVRNRVLPLVDRTTLPITSAETLPSLNDLRRLPDRVVAGYTCTGYDFLVGENLRQRIALYRGVPLEAFIEGHICFTAIGASLPATIDPQVFAVPPIDTATVRQAAKTAPECLVHFQQSITAHRR